MSLLNTVHSYKINFKITNLLKSTAITPFPAVPETEPAQTQTPVPLAQTQIPVPLAPTLLPEVPEKKIDC